MIWQQRSRGHSSGTLVSSSGDGFRPRNSSFVRSLVIRNVSAAVRVMIASKNLSYALSSLRRSASFSPSLYTQYIALIFSPRLPLVFIVFQSRPVDVSATDAPKSKFISVTQSGLCVLLMPWATCTWPT